MTDSGKVIVIGGPTASGKTVLSIELARRFDGEIVSADSMQIYRGMDIGTAKASPAERSAAVHHMIDTVSPDADYSVSAYVDAAAAVCDDILSRGKVPIIAGGTGLYIDSLLSGRDFGGGGTDSALRDTLEARYAAEGGEAMLNALSRFDPDRAALLHASDRKRIIRAFEVYLSSGETITEHDRRTKALPPRYSSLRIVTGYRDRELLYSRINQRVDDMFSAGLEDEVRSLLAAGVPEASTAMQAIGYKETAQYIKGELTLPEAVELIKQSSRRYAKRQLTWFRRWDDALWLYRDDENPADIPAAVSAFLLQQHRPMPQRTPS